MFAPTGIPGVTEGDHNLSAFNSTTGSAAIYIIMSVIMEFVVVVIYVVAGVVLPLDKDLAVTSQWAGPEEGMQLNAQKNEYVPPLYPPPTRSDMSSSISIVKY